MFTTVYLFVVYCLMSRAEELKCKDQTVSLTGGGSSLAAAVYNKVGAMYSAKRSQEGQKVAFSYKTRNSGYGLGRVTMTIPGEPPIVFGAADKTMSEKQTMLNRKLMTFPTLAGALLVIYNLPEGGNATLVLTGKVLAGIYRGKITHWDHPQIKQLNPLIPFSHHPIRLVVRSDNSGETFIFTGGLSKFDRIWNAMYGTFSNPKFVDGICCNSTSWPPDVVEFFANGVHGMIGIVGSIPYTIGYASEANVFESGHVKHAHFINKALREIEASQVAVQAAMDYYFGQPRSNAFVFDLNNALSPEAYPLASFSYMVVNASTHEEISCCQMQELVGFVEFLLKADSSVFTNHYLVPLSPLMVSLVIEDAVQTIQCKGKLAYVGYNESLKPEFKFEVWHAIMIGLTGLLFIMVGIIVLYGVQSRKAHKRTMTKWLLTGRVMFRVGNSETSFRDRVSSRLSAQSQNSHHRKCYYTRGEFEGNYVMLDKLSLKQTPKAWQHGTQTLINSLREDIGHKNILNLLGVAEIDGVNHTVMEDASKGTLHYVLQTCRYDVNDSIKYNLCLNATEGVAFLHRKQIVHGQLSSVNCYLDGSWTIKIAGWYRFTLIKQEDPQLVQTELSAPEEGEKEEDLIKLMYMDPDFIAQQKTVSDIFSLGLLWSEIFTRKLPFKDLSQSFIQDKFYKSADLMKSQVNLDEVPSNVKALIGICLGPKDDRPSAYGLTDMMKKLKPTSGSVVDVMMENMEEYSSTLESQVDEQASELNSMTKRLDDVYDRLLPNGIASKVLKEEPHIPEFYECVTVCSFSIIGFNEINEQSDPIERIKLMNELSALIDTIVEQLGMTKVYTIGAGGYMVCSGLQEKQKEKNHSGHIAEFTIELLEAMFDFKIKHLPIESPFIQCGIESGPVTAGVIGNELPQYCIFGETVDTASLMESTGELMKIHVAESAYELLKQNSPKHKLELRSESDVKGQLKSMKTYWLAVDSSRAKIYVPELPKI